MANPSDVPVFLSVRIVEDDVQTDTTVVENKKNGKGTQISDNDGSGSNRSPIDYVRQYEKDSAFFAREFEDNIVRF